MARAYLTAANVMLYGFVFLSGAVGVLYPAYGADHQAFDLLARLGLLYAVGHWLWLDSRRRGFRLPYCPGIALTMGWPILLPYYLYKTRGRKAILTGLIFLGAYVAAILLGAAAAVVLIGPRFD